MESDVFANISSDHYPLWMHVRAKLKAEHKRPTPPRPKFLKCTEAQRQAYNEDIRERMAGVRAYGDTIATLQLAGAEHIPSFKGKPKKNDLSDESAQILEHRASAIESGNLEEETRLTKELRKSKRRDKRKKVIETVSQDLDVREW